MHNGPPFSWPHIHPSAHWRAAAPAGRAYGALLEGAVRYTCPTNGSLVLLTDPAVLAALSSPLSRLRCTACGESHLLELREAGGPPAP